MIDKNKQHVHYIVTDNKSNTDGHRSHEHTPIMILIVDRHNARRDDHSPIVHHRIYYIT